VTVIPTALIIIPFLAAFFLVMWQYREIDPRRRVLNLRFVLAVGAVVAVFYYIFHVYFYPGDRRTSWIFEALSLIWVAWGWWLLRRMPPRETY
jgi:hypothetical protein